MNGVVEQIDLRAFPMEIARHMLELGNDLKMICGPTAYFQAECRLQVWLDTLSDYRKLYFDMPPVAKHLNSAIRFIQLHVGNESPEQLLAFMSYFPEDIAEYNYHAVLSEDELS